MVWWGTGDIFEDRLRARTSQMVLGPGTIQKCRLVPLPHTLCPGILCSRSIPIRPIIFTCLHFDQSVTEHMTSAGRGQCIRPTVGCTFSMALINLMGFVMKSLKFATILRQVEVNKVGGAYSMNCGGGALKNAHIFVGRPERGNDLGK